MSKILSDFSEELIFEGTIPVRDENGQIIGEATSIGDNRVSVEIFDEDIAKEISRPTIGISVGYACTVNNEGRSNYE
jgi:hypothetical protein